jgi:hypothetical protein
MIGFIKEYLTFFVLILRSVPTPEIFESRTLEVESYLLSLLDPNLLKHPLRENSLDL